MKKCVLYADRICSDCGECLICDLDPKKLCDNCGKCISASDDDEFLSMIVHAAEDEDEAFDDGIVPLSEEDIEQLSDEEKQLLAFLDAPIDLNVPEPLNIDHSLYEKWERILAEDAARGHDAQGELKVQKAPASYAIRTRRRK